MSILMNTEHSGSTAVIDELDVSNRTRGDYLVLRVSLLSCLIYVGFGLTGFAVLAGFWPPPSEHLDAAGITAYFHSQGNGLRIGMVMMAFGAPFYYVWSAVLSKIIGRIEGPMGVLSTVELLGGLLTAWVTVMPAIIWLTASMRPGVRSPETVQTLYDLGWIFFDLTFACSLIQNLGLGFAILRDRRTAPLIPHWVAWVSFLTAATYVPLVLVPFFKTGPFAWQGLISFWAVFVMFFVLIAVVTPYAWKALRRLEAEDLAAVG
ncbi:MAG: hypothetical protein JWR52_2158 [Marmoricola sp.]|nr:hypothetical protein [Marmoricola sp.]